MVKIAHLDDAFLEVSLTASKPSRKSITAAKRKEKEKKERQKKIEKPKDGGHFFVQKLFFRMPEPQCRNKVKRDASGKKGKLSCCKCLLD